MKRKVLIGVASLLAFLPVGLLIACNSSPSTTKAISTAGLSAAQVAVDAFMTIYLPAADQTEVNSLFQKAIASVGTFTPGSASSEVVQILSDLGNALDAIPQVPNQTDDAIAAAVNFVDNLITIVQTETASTEESRTAIFIAWMNNDTPPPTHRKHAWHGKQIKTFNQFKSAWNKSLPKNSPAKIK